MISFFDLLVYIFYFWFILIALKIIYWFYKVCFRKRKDLLNIYGKDSWVLVTGATDGIGKGFCEEFARTGFNIILVSRTQSKLDDVAKQLKEINPKIKTKTVVFDFSIKNKLLDYQNDFSKIFSEYDISILVNNIGRGGPNSFSDLSLTDIQENISLNIIPQVYMTKLLLGRLKERNNRSAIINLSSVVGTYPLTYFSQYGSAKAFNHFLSKGIEYEESNKIDIMSVKPFYVTSPLSGLSVSNGFDIVTPAQCVNGSLDCLGYENETCGYLSHQLLSNMYYLRFFVSENFTNKVIEYLVKDHMKVHEKNKNEK